MTSGASGGGLRALDALEAAEVPAFLQARSDAGQLLSEGAGQPGKESLHLGGVNLQTQTTGWEEGFHLGFHLTRHTTAHTWVIQPLALAPLQSCCF